MCFDLNNRQGKGKIFFCTRQLRYMILLNVFSRILLVYYCKCCNLIGWATAHYQTSTRSGLVWSTKLYIFLLLQNFEGALAMRNLIHATANAMTATRPNTPATATPPIRVVWLPWSESVHIKKVNTFQKIILKQRGLRGVTKKRVLSAVQTFKFFRPKQSRN